MVHFEVIKDMILKRTETRHVTVYTENEIKRKRKAGAIVSILTEPEDKMYRFSLFKCRRLGDNSYVPFG